MFLTIQSITKHTSTSNVNVTQMFRPKTPVSQNQQSQLHNKTSAENHDLTIADNPSIREPN